MHIPFVDLEAQHLPIKGEIDRAIRSVVEGDLFVAGKAVMRFETEFADYLGARHAIGCANGTDALEIAIKALGIGVGDEVIVPAFTWISTAGAVSNMGADPVFVDVLEKERTIDPDQIEEKITSKTKAIIPVHLYGLPARMKEINQIAKRHNLRVIEDCAQAHGAAIGDQKVGTFGDLATFSFYPSKNLGSLGDGGAIVTSSDELAEKCRRLGNHGQLIKHDHRLIGRNSRLDSIQAAVLSVKLRYLDQWNEQRIELAANYTREIKGGITPFVPQNYKHVFHLYVVEVSNRESLRKRLADKGIETSVHYPNGLTSLTIWNKEHKAGDFPNTERLSKTVLSLPMPVNDQGLRQILELNFKKE